MLKELTNPVVHDVIDNQLLLKGFTYNALQATMNSLYFLDVSEYINKICLSFTQQTAKGLLKLFVTDEVLYAELLNGDTLLFSNCATIYETNFTNNAHVVIEEIESFMKEALC